MLRIFGPTREIVRGYKGKIVPLFFNSALHNEGVLGE